MCNEYFTFCEQEDLGHGWPAPDAHLMQFSIHLHRKGLAPRSTQGRMPALAFYIKAQGFKGFTINFCIWKMIEWWSKERVSTDTCTRILLPILIRLGSTWDMVCKDQFEACLFRAATLIVVFLVPTGK